MVLVKLASDFIVNADNIKTIVVEKKYKLYPFLQYDYTVVIKHKYGKYDCGRYRTLNDAERELRRIYDVLRDVQK